MKMSRYGSRGVDACVPVLESGQPGLGIAEGTQLPQGERRPGRLPVTCCAGEKGTKKLAGSGLPCQRSRARIIGANVRTQTFETVYAQPGHPWRVTKPEGFRSLHRAFFPIHYLGVEHLYITCPLPLAEGSANGMQRSWNICIGIPSADPSSGHRNIFTSSREFHVLPEAGSVAALPAVTHVTIRVASVLPGRRAVSHPASLPPTDEHKIWAIEWLSRAVRILCVRSPASSVLSWTPTTRLELSLMITWNPWAWTPLGSPQPVP